MERIECSDERAAHIRTRSHRYPGAVDIEPEWTQEAVNDENSLVDGPDPKSTHANNVRIIGYSPAAKSVITVAALRDRHGVLHGTSAWRTSGRRLSQYMERRCE